MEGTFLQFDPRDGGFPLFVAWETVPSADGDSDGKRGNGYFGTKQ